MTIWLVDIISPTDLKILTNFGDAAVLIPISAVFAIWLLATSPVRLALIWLAAACFCNGLLSLLKIYLLACPASRTLHSPSGHTGFSILVYGSLTAVLAFGVRGRGLKTAIVVLGGALMTAIAASRFALGNHSLLEVSIGALIGCVGLAVFVRAYRRDGVRRGPPVALAIIVVLVAAAFHGQHLGAEEYLKALGVSLGLRGHACFDR